MTKFNRRIRLTAGDVELDSEEVTIQGTIPFSERWEDNIAEVNVFNLDDATISQIGEADSIQIEAGYEGDVGLLYEGTIRGISTTTQQDDRVTEIQSGTGFRRFDFFISKDWLVQVSANQIADDIISQVDLVERGRLQISGDSYPKHSIHRTAIKEIEGINRDFDALTYLRELQFFGEPEDELVASRETVLSEREGLKGQRKGFSRFRETETVEIESLLNRNIFTGAVITLTGTRLDGTYRVIDGTHSLTRFSSMAKLVEVAA